jgi:hypothetical protein
LGAERFEKELLDQRPAAHLSRTQPRLVAQFGARAAEYLRNLPQFDRALPRQIAELNELVRSYGPEAVAQAIDKAAAAHAFGSDYIANILRQQSSPRPVEPPVRLKDPRLNALAHRSILAVGIRRISARRPGKGKIMTLAEKLERLRLLTMSRQLDQALQHAAEKSLSPAVAIEWLADLELEERNGRAVQRQYHFSRLPGQHSIDSFLFRHHKSRLQNKCASSVSRISTSSTRALTSFWSAILAPGKTFLSKIIGWRACQANRRVLFTTAMDMLNQLTASQVDHSLVRRLKFYTDPALLICD